MRSTGCHRGRLSTRCLARPPLLIPGRPRAMSKNKSLILPNDHRMLVREIRKLQELGYKMTRPSPHHLKIGSTNYFPSTGTITTYPCYRHIERGFEALLRILENASTSA